MGCIHRSPDPEAGPPVGASPCIFAFYVLKYLCRDIVSSVLDDIPPDLTDLEDAVHSALLLGRPTQALVDAARLDVWLAAHIADVLDALDLVDKTPDEYVSLSLTSTGVVMVPFQQLGTHSSRTVYNRIC